MKKITNYEDFINESKYCVSMGEEPQLSETDISKLVDIDPEERKAFLQKMNRFAEYEIKEGMLHMFNLDLEGLELGEEISKFIINLFQIPEGTVLYKVFTIRFFYLAIAIVLEDLEIEKEH